MVNNTIEMPNQRVSLKEKQSSTWTKKMADYVLQLAFSSNDKSQTKRFLEMANGVVDKEMYNYVLKTFNSKSEISSKSDNNSTIIKDLREIDFLQPIKDKYLGEFINSYNNYQIYSDDPDALFIRNKEFGESVMSVLNQMLVNELNKKGVNTNQESKETPDIEKMMSKFISDWDNKRIEEAQDRLNLLNEEIEAKLKFNQLYYYWWACEECYDYRYVHKNKVIYEVVSPLEYYRIDSGNTFVEDDEYGVRISLKSLYQILDLYEDLLSKEDVTFLKQYCSSDVTNETKIGLLKSRLVANGMSNEDFVSYNQYSATNNAFKNPELIPVAHYVAKTEVKVGYLVYVNESGELSEKLVSEDYEFSEKNGDISIKWDYIQQMYQGEIIGYSNDSNLEAIYTKFRPIDIQRESFSNVNSCKSPYNGISYIHKDSEKKPIPYRVNQHIALYRIYHYQIEKAIQKWKAIIAIPESLLSDSEEMKLEERLKYADLETLLIYNDADVNPNLINGIKEVATSATFNFVSTLMSLLTHIKESAWEEANMTRTRMGNQAPYQGKGVTENQLEQVQISSSWSLDVFNYFRCRSYLANNDYSKIAWSDGKEGSYINESTNESVRVKVDPLNHISSNIGIHIGNSKLLNDKLYALKQYSFNLGQNGNSEIALESILNDNIKVLKQKVLEAIDSKRQYDAQIENLKNISAEKIAAMNKETEYNKQQHEIELENLKTEKEITTAYINQETQLLVWDMRLSKDVNGNGYIDDNENALSNAEELKNLRRKIDIQEQTLSLKRKSLLSKDKTQDK